MGHADYSTRRLMNKIDFPTTYANCLTSTVVVPARMPVILDSDRDAILAAVKTCNASDVAKVRAVRIKDTLHLSEIYISEALLAEAATHPELEVLGPPTEMVFDEAGNLLATPARVGTAAK